MVLSTSAIPRWSVRHLLTTVGPRAFGLGSVALNLVREQRALGLDAKIWCLDKEEDIAWARATSDLPPEAIIGFPHLGPRFLGWSPALERALLGSEGRSVHVIHQHGLWTGISRGANRWRRRFARPTVIAPHGQLEAWAVRRSAWKKALAKVAYQNENLQSAACFHATSATEADGFREYGVTKPIAVIPNGLSEAWIDSRGDGARFRAAYGIPDDKRIILYVGRVTPVKNLEAMLEAMAAKRENLYGWALVVAGPDEFGYRKKLDKMIETYQLSPYVRFVGFIAQELKRDAYAAASIFVLPSLREASPISVLEALGAGVPVLTTRGTPWEDIERYRCGWWCDLTPQAIGLALESALTTPAAELTKLGERGRALVRSKYTWTAAATHCQELYNWLLGAASRPDIVG